MGLTSTRRHKLAEQAEADGIIAPDSSTLVHRFADGWTMHRLETVGDVRREGWLMSNCCPKYVGDTLKAGSCEVEQRSDKPDYSPFDASSLSEAKLSLPGAPEKHMHLHSLRDKLGMPHVTLFALEGVGVDHLGGVHNPKVIKPVYVERVENWARLTGSIMLTDPARKAQMLGRAVYEFMVGAHPDTQIELITSALEGAQPELCDAVDELRMAYYGEMWGLHNCERAIQLFTQREADGRPGAASALVNLVALRTERSQNLQDMREGLEMIARADLGRIDQQELATEVQGIAADSRSRWHTAQPAAQAA